MEHDQMKQLGQNIGKGLQILLNTITEETPDGKTVPKVDLKTAKDLVGALAEWAGKGKDEVLQIVSKEIGVALANVLREPVAEAMRKKRLKITLEFGPEEDDAAAAPSPPPPKRAPHAPHRAKKPESAE